MAPGHEAPGGVQAQRKPSLKAIIARRICTSPDALRSGRSLIVCNFSGVVAAAHTAVERLLRGEQESGDDRQECDQHHSGLQVQAGRHGHPHGRDRQRARDQSGSGHGNGGVHVS